MEWQYDGRAPLPSCEYPNLHRQVGVCASEPFDHAGKKKRMVEVIYERPYTNTITASAYVDADQWRPEALAQTRIVLEHVDQILLDLAQQRLRLAAEIERLEKEVRTHE